MTISRIQETRRGRFALFDEAGAFVFSVDGETLVKNGLREGTVLDAGALVRLHGQSETRKAKDKALTLLSVRDHASGELYEKLRRTFDEHSAAAAVAEMQLLGLLNDAAWACRRAEYLAGRHKSVREIARDLASKGVERGLIDDALASLVPAGGEDGGDESLDAAACRALVAKHYMRKLAAGRADSVLAALARRGFARADARAAVAAALETLEQESCGPDGMAARCNEME